MPTPHNTVYRILVYTTKEDPFYIQAYMFKSFVEWFADQRGVSVDEAENILQNE